MTRCLAAGLYPGASSRGVYLINCVFCSWLAEVAACSMADPVGFNMATLVDTSACNALAVRSVAALSSSSVGKLKSSA
eukprot:scaffold54391_cov44-Attheya_sp.AAC.1